MTAANLFGKPLPEGGTIGVAAPASPFESRSDILRSVEWWESRGYRVKLAEHVLARDDYLAGDPRDRAADLASLFANSEVDVVQCLQGGHGSAEVLPFLDFDVVAANPKPFLGFSDITSLHVAIRQRTGLATFYGNGLLGMGDPETTSFSKERLLDVLRGNGAGKVPDNPDDPYLRPIRGGKATAPLVGGCLSLLVSSMGTPWEFDLEGTIFFFEDVGLEPYRADAILTQLAQSGKCSWIRVSSMILLVLIIARTGNRAQADANLNETHETGYYADGTRAEVTWDLSGHFTRRRLLGGTVSLR